MNKGWKFQVDPSEWALPLFIHWTPGMVGIHFLCFSLVWWFL